jgi:thiol:disulfide interchange protein DsbD
MPNSLHYFLALLLTFLLHPAFATGAGDLLPPEQAFRFSARALDDGRLEVTYAIEPGYYLYRDRFRFSAKPPASLGDPVFAAGKVKTDKFFGSTETYRDQVRVTIPVTAGADGDILLTAVSQGCADVGVCFPPRESTATLSFAAQALPPASASPSSAVGDALGSIGIGARSGQDVLPADRAFRVGATMRDPTTVVVRFTPAEGYYLFKDKTAFRVDAPAGVSVAAVDLPAAQTKHDPTFGQTEVYHRPFEAVIRLRRDRDDIGHAVLSVSYQGCADKGICYPPMSKTFDLDLSSASAAPIASQAAALPGGDAEDSRIARALKDGGLWAAVLAFFGFGLLLAFTPCVFPMIPILSGIIAGHEHTKLNHVRGFLLALAYVSGMALTYAAAGVAAGLSGTMLSAALQNPWVLGTLAAIFVLLAFSMFGFYDLQLPPFLQSKLAAEANRLHGGHFASVFAMGAVSALIVGPCVAPPLAGALLYISQTRDVVQGGAALFSMGLGMGVPLLLIGATGGAVLPRSGPWMESVKQVFGVVMLAMAIWLIAPLIPTVAQMLLWAALLICSAIYLHALDPLPHAASGFRKLWKGVGVIALLTGIAVLIGALSGSRDILQPLSGLRVTAGGSSLPALPFVRVLNVAELEARLAAARGRPVLLDFYADWCLSCKEMEHFTLSDPRVRAKLDRFVLLQADVTENGAGDQALLQRFNLFGPPGYVFFGASGDELAGMRVTGFKSADEFLRVLDQVVGT